MLGMAVPHLVEHLGHVLVVPVQAEAAADLLDDPEVLLRVAGRVDGLPAQLHQAVGVGEGAGLLGKALAGSTTSARQAVSVRKMSCTTRCPAAPGLAGVVGIGVRTSPGSRP
jgi:hypothetical protein